MIPAPRLCTILAAVAAATTSTTLVAQQATLTAGALRSGAFTRWSVALNPDAAAAVFVTPSELAHPVKIASLGIWHLGTFHFPLALGQADSTGFYTLDVTAPAFLKPGTRWVAQAVTVDAGVLSLSNSSDVVVGNPAQLRTTNGSVDATVPGDYATIQAAVRQASDVDSDGTIVIQVQSGTYNENVEVRRSNIELRGDASNPPEIRGRGHDDTLEVTAVSRFRIDGFLITNDNGSLPSVEEGLHVRASTGVEIVDCTFRGNQEGVKIETTSGFTVTDNVMQGNTHEGLQVRDSSNGTIRGNSLTSNGHSGADVRESSDVTIDDNQSTGNGDHGIRVRDAGSSITIRNNTCTGNSSDGARIEATSNAVVIGNTLSNNNGTGLRLRDASGSVTGNTMNDNREYGIRLRDSNIDFGSGAAPQGDNTTTGNVRGNFRVD